MSDLTYQVSADVKKALKGLNDVKQEMKGISQQAKKTDKATDGMSKNFSALASVISVAAIAMGAFKAVQTAAEFEVLKTTLKSVTGSVEEAAVAFRFVQDIAQQMPFDLQQVTTAYTKMTALGIAPTKEALIAFANVASATGKTLDQFTEAVADAITGEFERLKEFGIKVKNEGDTLKVTFQGMTKSIENDSASIQKYLQSIGETEFAGAAADQMNTLTGKWNNFVDSLSIFADQAVTSSGTMDLLKEGLTLLTETVQWTQDGMGGFAEFLSTDLVSALEVAAEATKPLWEGYRVLGAMIIDTFGDDTLSITKAFFTDTRQFGVAMVDGLGQQFLSLQKYWNILTEGMEFAWTETINSIGLLFNEMVNSIIETTNSISSFFGLDSLKIELLSVADTTGTWADRMDKVNKAYDDNVKVHKQAIELWHQEVDAQNKLKELEKERAKIAKALESDEHNKSLIAKQKALNEQVAAEKEAGIQEKAYADEMKKTVKEAQNLAQAHRNLIDPMQQIAQREDAITEAFEAGKISAEEFFDAMDQLDTERLSVSDKMLDDSRKWSDGWKRAMTDYVDDATNAAANAERVFGNSMSSMEDAFVEFAKTGKLEWKSLANSIIEDLLRIQFRKMAAGLFTGGSGGSNFAGLFADGGTIPAGQFGIVGERGPELVNGPATVTPMDQLGGMGGGPTNINYSIYANDALSFKQMIARDPKFLYAVTEEGRRGLPYR